MSVRPLVTVQKENKVIRLPRVFLSPIRYDVIHFVHTLMRLNTRHPYAVSRRAGHKNSAESWGTGRAVARVPRVSGGGTHRSGQGAYGNMCRGGHMAFPTKVFRRWNKPCNVKMRQMAVRAALAASAVPALVLARGHRIAKVPEVPLVVSNNFEKISKTRAAIKFMRSLGLKADLLRCKFSRQIRAGKGKGRNRRYTMKKGPLVICNNMRFLHLSLRNIPGVDLMHVKHLNLLRLCPGGHVGRLIIWTEAAFRKLDEKFRHFKPGHVVDGKRVINSEEVQAVLRRKHKMPRRSKKANTVKRIHQLNPGFKVATQLERRRLAYKRKIDAQPKLKSLLRYKAMIKRKRWMARVSGLLTRANKPVKGKLAALTARFPMLVHPRKRRDDKKREKAARPIPPEERKKMKEYKTRKAEQLKKKTKARHEKAMEELKKRKAEKAERKKRIEEKMAKVKAMKEKGEPLKRTTEKKARKKAIKKDVEEKRKLVIAKVKKNSERAAARRKASEAKAKADAAAAAKPAAADKKKK